MKKITRKERESRLLISELLKRLATCPMEDYDKVRAALIQAKLSQPNWPFRAGYQG